MDVDKGEIVCFTEQDKGSYYVIDPETLSSIKADLKIDDLNSLIAEFNLQMQQNSD